jgi:arylsulfatase
MAYTFDKANADAPSRHTTHLEMLGNRAIYHDGWMVSDPWNPGLAALKMLDANNGYNWGISRRRRLLRGHRI